MHVLQRVVFPTIRILIWAVIAASLAWMAFSGATEQTADPHVPSAVIADPVVEVVAGTVTNTVQVPALVQADAAVPVRATGLGTVTKVVRPTGTAVAAGDALLVVTEETPRDPLATTDPETGEQTVTEQEPTLTRTTVTAPAAGTVRIDVLVNQVVSVGDAVGAVDPGTLSVVGTLTAAQQFRLIGAPTEAQVTLTGGPAPFTCTGLRIGAAPAGQGADPGTGGDQQSATGSVSCALPAEVTAFVGLGATISITNGSAADVPVVPVTAVQGSVQSGNVWVVVGDGEPAERAVVLGLTDGAVVQVVSGLELGETVLQFVPAGEPTTVDPAQLECMQQGDTTVCEG